MQKNYNVHFTKNARTPNERYFLDPELGHQKGKGSFLRGWAVAGEAGRGGWVLNLCTREETGSREKSHKSQLWHMPGVPAFSRLRWGDCCKFRASLGYRVRLVLQKRAKTGSRSVAQAGLDLGSNTPSAPASPTNPRQQVCITLLVSWRIQRLNVTRGWEQGSLVCKSPCYGG